MPESTIPAPESGRHGAWRIVLALGNHGLAAVEHGTDPPIEVRFRRAIGRPLPGDRVELDDQHAVSRILPRTSTFGRGGRHGEFQAVAANLDTLLIVIAPQPAPSVDLLHRYVAAARIAGIQPLIIVNKCDLPIPEAPPFNALDDLSLPVLRVRTEPQADLDGLPFRLATGLHLLAGQSGVGKTSISNVLLPDLELQTEKLSRATGKGRHTTTSARLFRLPGGGWLGDTPGVWEYGLWRMPPTELARGFPEFHALPGCRFRDCRHEHEPGCAVRDAVEDGRVPASRHRAWLSLLREQDRLAAMRRS